MRSVLVLFAYGHMADDEPLPDAETPEWPIAWAIKRTLRLHLGPRHRYLPSHIAREVVTALRLSKWLIIKRAPDPPHSTPGE